MAIARFFSLLAVLLVATTLSADEEKPPVSPEIQELVRQLDADDFNERETAGEELMKRGKEAIPALEEAVRGNSLEAATRCFEILQHQFKQGSDEAKVAAKAALGRLSEGEDNIARLAKKLLETPVPTPRPSAPGVRLGGGVRVAAVRKSMSISVANGVKTIHVEEEGRKTKIVEDGDKGIEIEITQPKDGKETTEKFAAKTADELKEKHPEAHKVYEQYAKGAGGVRVEIDGAVFGKARMSIRERLQEQTKKLEETLEKLEGEDLPDDSKALRREVLQKTRDRLAETLKEMEAREKAEEKKAEAEK